MKKKTKRKKIQMKEKKKKTKIQGREGLL